MRNIKQKLRKLSAWALVAVLLGSGLDGFVLAADGNSAAVHSSAEFSDGMQEDMVGTLQTETEAFSDMDSEEEVPEEEPQTEAKQQTGEAAPGIEAAETETQTQEGQQETTADPPAETEISASEDQTEETEPEPEETVISKDVSADSTALEIANDALDISEICKGSGTQSDPYQISNAETLKKFRDYVNEGNACTGLYFKLTADIDLNNEAWTPIGDYADYGDYYSNESFDGTFDGGGYTISGLYINSSLDYQGLFGHNCGTIKNLMVSGSVTAVGVTGGIAAFNNGRAVIVNCRSAVTVTLTGKSSEGNESAGGIAGSNGGSITNCMSVGSVAGSGNVGGIAGVNNGNLSGVITNCYYLDTAAGSGSGSNTGSDSSVSKTADQFASGEVAYLLQGSQDGNIWGQTIGTDASPVLTSAENRRVYQVIFGYTAEDAADVVKYTNYGGTVSLPDGSGFAASTGSITQWLTADGEIFTSGTQVMGDLTMTEQTSFFAQGSGSQEDPYRISDAETLKYFRDYVNAGNACKDLYFHVTSDIDLNNEVWTPIGNYADSTSLVFSGTFDGGGYMISGLYINAPNMAFQGLFGKVVDGAVQNLSVSGSVSASGIMGGVVGYNDGGTMQNLSMSGRVTGVASQVGGVVGASYNGVIINCTNSSTVSGANGGGIVSYSFDSTIINCYNTGAVSGNYYAGGITVEVVNGAVTNCYNIGAVSGNWYSGGIVGVVNNAIITNCYYMEGTADDGIANGSGEAASKTMTEFASGEVTYLLQGSQDGNIWGQDVSTDAAPVLTSDAAKRVYKVTFRVGGADYHVAYANSGDTVVVPSAPEGSSSGYWKIQDGGAVTGSLTVGTGDITVIYTAGEPDILSVEVLWDALKYTYKDGAWNPDTHTYEDGEWTADGGENSITVKNNGNVDTTVSYQYSQSVDAVSGEFSDDDGNEIASPVALSKGEEKKAYLTLTGRPEDGFNGTLGTIIVMIGDGE